MQIQVISDIHSNFDQIKISPDADLILLCGDLCNGFSEAIEWLISLDKECIWIPGNHERYKTKQRQEDLTVIHGLRNKKYPKISLGERKTFTFQNTRIICATLWHDYYGISQEGFDSVKDRLNDFQYIDTSLFSGDESTVASAKDALSSVCKGHTHIHHCILAEHSLDLSYIREELSKPFDGTTIVATHHAPLIHSNWLAGYIPVLKGRPPLGLNLQNAPYRLAGYCSNTDWLMKKYKPSFWIHGHFHKTMRYAFRDTVIISNPFGRGPSENPLWRDDFMLDIDNPEWISNMKNGAIRSGLETMDTHLSELRKSIQKTPSFFQRKNDDNMIYELLEVFSDFIENQPFFGGLPVTGYSESFGVNELKNFCDNISMRIGKMFESYGWPRIHG